MTWFRNLGKRQRNLTTTQTTHLTWFWLDRKFLSHYSRKWVYPRGNLLDFARRFRRKSETASQFRWGKSRSETARYLLAVSKEGSKNLIRIPAEAFVFGASVFVVDPCAASLPVPPSRSHWIPPPELRPLLPTRRELSIDKWQCQCLRVAVSAALVVCEVLFFGNLLSRLGLRCILERAWSFDSLCL